MSRTRTPVRDGLRVLPGISEGARVSRREARLKDIGGEGASTDIGGCMYESDVVEGRCGPEGSTPPVKRRDEGVDFNIPSIPSTNLLLPNSAYYTQRSQVKIVQMIGCIG